MEFKEILKRFNNSYSILEQTSPFLVDEKQNPISLLDYWAKGRQRFNKIASLPKFSATEAWRSRYTKGTTRNKILGLISHLTEMNIDGSVIAQNKDQLEDVVASRLLNDLLDYTKEKEKFPKKKFWSLVVATAEGTVIWKENWGEMKKKLKEIEEIDEDGKVKYNEKEVETWKGAYLEVVPNECFLPQNPYTIELEDQDFVIYWNKMTLEQARKFYGHYPKFEEVQAGKILGISNRDKQYRSFNRVIELQKNEVVIIEHYNQVDDVLDIFVNGVQLTDENNPIPRPITEKGKRVPFTIQRLEPIDMFYMWGKSWADRLGTEEDAINLLYRLFTDREYLNTFPPLDTDDDTLLNEDVIRPGLVVARTMGKDGMRPIIQATPTTALLNLIQSLEQNASEESLSQLQMGQVPSGGTPTATQTLQMAKSAQTMLNTFTELQRQAIVDITEQRLDTIIWKLDEFGNKITVFNRTLTNGKKGTRQYRFENIKGLTEEEQLKKSFEVKAMEDKHDNLEIVILDKNEIKNNIHWFVNVSAEPKPRRTDDLNKMMTMDRFMFYRQNQDIFNPVAIADDIAEVFGDNPEEVVRKQQMQPQGEQGMLEGMPQGLPEGEPEGMPQANPEPQA